ncbi:MAG: ROK family protein [Planctomycetota bacterium]
MRAPAGGGGGGGAGGAGAGLGCADLLMVTLGTGVGSSAVVGGRVLRAGHGHGGVLGGHLTVRLDGTPCACGNTGCVEAEASTARLGELIGRLARDGHGDSPLRRVEQPTYRDVFALAAAGDALALAVRDETYRVWSAGVLNLVLAYGSTRVLLGGGVAAGAAGLCGFMREYLHTHGWITWGEVAVEPAALGNDAALWGGLFLADEFLPLDP